MYCGKCGAQLTQDGLCPNCDTVQAQITEPDTGKKKPKREPGNFAKGYAALFTALMVFPASLCTAIDLSVHSYDYWFGYVVGFFIVAWICLVFPFMEVTPPAVTAVICIVAVFGYASYIFSKLGNIPFISWLYKTFLPLLILFAVFVAVDTAMISSGKFDWMKVLSAISFEIGVFFVAMEFFGQKVKDLGNLRWSPIASCGFISVSAVFLAFSYIWKNSKKK